MNSIIVIASAAISIVIVISFICLAVSWNKTRKELFGMICGEKKTRNEEMRKLAETQARIDKEIEEIKEVFDLADNLIKTTDTMKIIEEPVMPSIDSKLNDVRIETKNGITKITSRPKRKPFQFSFTDLKIGDTIVCTLNGETATVKDMNNHIVFRNTITSLSTAARIITKEETGEEKRLDGPRYWTYEETTLDKLRKDPI